MNSIKLRKGMRIEIPVHFNAWMMGVRFGTLTQYRNGKNGSSDFWFVKMDHPDVKRRVKLSRLDWEYIKLID
jgi:hypothetical protein